MRIAITDGFDQVPQQSAAAHSFRPGFSAKVSSKPLAFCHGETWNYQQRRRFLHRSSNSFFVMIADCAPDGGY